MYPTRADAIYRAISPALDVPGDFDATDFDTEAILDEAFNWSGERGGYVQIATGRDFWDIVHRHAL